MSNPATPKTKETSTASKISKALSVVSELPKVKLGLKTTEFGTASTLITYLVVQNQITGEIAYVYAAAIVAGAYILSRSIIKALEVLKK